jgi:hypothetical protein
MTNNAQPPDPGIYHDIPFEDYLSWPYINNGALSYASRSMAHYRHRPDQEPTDAMRFGALVHCGQLEPAAIGARYAVMPDFAKDIRRPDGTEYANPRATSAYKRAVAEWSDSIGDREQCTAEQMEVLLGISRSITLHDQARVWLCADGPVEVSIVWDDVDSGIRCKGRVDKWVTRSGRHLLVDLKTSRDVGRFEDAFGRYSYHRQAAFYLDGVRTLTGSDDVQFGIVAVEKEAPFAVRAALVSDDATAVGREQYKHLLAQLAECQQTDTWPGYESPKRWNLPEWLSKKSENEVIGISINGEIVA